jgi:MFS family permease
VTRPGLLGRGLAPVTVACVATVSLAAFDAVAVIAILPRLTADLGDVALLSWVITGFLVASTVSVIVAGPVIDALGVRATFRATIVLFGAASVACALAPNVLTLVAFRVVQGVGAGLVIAVALAAVGLVYPQDLLPRAYAANSAVWGGMAIAGPAVAAALAAAGGWRAIFVANVPLCALAGVLAWRRFPGARADAGPLHVDARGVALIGAFTVVSLVGFSSFSLWALGALAAAVGLAAAYWLHARRTPGAVLEPRYFARMPLSAVHVASASVFGGCLGLQAYLPMFVQGGLGRSAGTAAASVLFLSVGWSAASIGVSRFLGRVHPVDAGLAGFALVLPALAVGVAVVGDDAPLALVWGLVVVQGLGVGVVSTSFLTYLQQQVDPGGIGRVNAAHQYARNLAYTYCAALAGAVVLLVVDRDVGDVEAVRDLLSGDGTATDAATASAIAGGFRWAHLAALAVVGTGAAAAAALRRSAPRDTPAPTNLRHSPP